MTWAVVFAIVALAVGVYASAIVQGDRRWWALGSLLVLFVIGSRLVTDAWRTWLLDGAEFCAVALAWTHGPQARLAARSYLAAIVVGSVCVGAAEALLRVGDSRLLVALLVLGFAAKLGLVPCTFWLPRPAARVPAMTNVLIVSVLDITGTRS